MANEGETDIQQQQLTDNSNNQDYPEEQQQQEEELFGSHEDEWVKNVVGDLILWRSPIHTGLWLVVFFLIFFLVEISDYSLLTLFSYLILLQLLFTTSAIRGAPTLKGMGLIRPSFDPKIFALQRQAFTPDEMARFSRGMSMIMYEAIIWWNDALITSDAKKVLKTTGMLSIMCILGLLLTFDQTILLIVLTAFTIPRVYESEGDRIDEFLAVMKEAAERRLPLDRIYTIIENLASRLEPVLGRLEL
jgi:hypothetical protein